MLDKLIALLNGNILLLTRKFEDVILNLKNLSTSFYSLSKDLKDQTPKVTVNVPDNSEAIKQAIKSGFDSVEIKVPDITIPDIATEIIKGFEGITINVPEIKSPRIIFPEQKAPIVNVPAPIVNVSSPEKMKLEGMDSLMEVLKTLGSNVFSKISRKNSIPVVVIDDKGEPVNWKRLFASVQPQFVGGGVHGLSGGSSTATSPIEGYKVADLDDSANPAYYGYINASGAWYILKEDKTTGAYRYTKGDSAYSTAWTDRASKTYGYFNVIFG
jgi:hypothetical protein